MLVFNGTQVKRVVFNGTQINRLVFNGTTVFTSEEDITPTWSLSGSGWTDTTWGEWSVGRDEGDLLTAIAEAQIETNGHSRLRFTPTGYGFRTGRSRGAIRIKINGTTLFEMGASAERTTPVELDISGYTGTVTLRVELVADWGYTDMYCSQTLKLHD